jgi:hypothetical protein
MGEAKGGVRQGWWFRRRWRVSCEEENQEEICLGWHQYNRDLRGFLFFNLLRFQLLFSFQNLPAITSIICSARWLLLFKLRQTRGITGSHLINRIDKIIIECRYRRLAKFL